MHSLTNIIVRFRNFRTTQTTLSQSLRSSPIGLHGKVRTFIAPVPIQKVVVDEHPSSVVNITGRATNFLPGGSTLSSEMPPRRERGSSSICLVATLSSENGYGNAEDVESSVGGKLVRGVGQIRPRLIKLIPPPSDFARQTSPSLGLIGR